MKLDDEKTVRLLVFGSYLLMAAARRPDPVRDADGKVDNEAKITARAIADAVVEEADRLEKDLPSERVR
jgi:hypothetical protein